MEGWARRPERMEGLSMEHMVTCAECGKDFRMTNQMKRNVLAVAKSGAKPDSIDFCCAECEKMLPVKGWVRVDADPEFN